MFVRYMTKGTWLYCSEICLEAANPNAAQVVGWPSVDSSEYVPNGPNFGDDAGAWLAARGWTDSKCDRCRSALIKPMVDIAIGYLPGQDSRGDYALIDFLSSLGRVAVSGLISAESVREWVRDHPPATVAWRWRESIYVSTALGKMIPLLDAA